MDLSKILYVETPNVQAVTTTASDATAVNTAARSGLYRFFADADVWIKWGPAAVAAPDPTAVTGTGRCWKIPGGQTVSVTLGDEQQYFRAITDATTGTAKLRWAMEMAG